MLNILASYLAEAATSELRGTIEHSFELFARIDLPAYEERYEEILALDDQVEAGATVQAIVDQTLANQRGILQEHGIVLVEHATLAFCNDMVEAILQLGDYDDAAVLIQTANLSGTSEEVLAELLALTSTHAADEILLHLETVSEALITGVKRLAQTFDSEPIAVVANDSMDSVARLVRWCNYIGTRQLAVAEAINQGMAVGLPFLTYANLLGRELEAMSVDKACHELIGMALASRDGCANPHATIKEHLEQFISSPDMTTKIDVRLTDLLLGFGK